jgi:hypothetical protein
MGVVDHLGLSFLENLRGLIKMIQDKERVALCLIDYFFITFCS